MSDAVYNRLAFNGFHVTFYNHETRQIEQQHFPDVKSVLDRKFEGIPDTEEFVAGLFDDWGDVVGLVIDNDGVELYSNTVEMLSTHQSFAY